MPKTHRTDPARGQRKRWAGSLTRPVRARSFQDETGLGDRPVTRGVPHSRPTLISPSTHHKTDVGVIGLLLALVLGEATGHAYPNMFRETLPARESHHRQGEQRELLGGGFRGEQYLALRRRKKRNARAGARRRATTLTIPTRSTGTRSVDRPEPIQRPETARQSEGQQPGSAFPEEEPAANASPRPAPPVDSAALQRGARVEFDGRLVQGQTAKSGAIYLFARRRSELRSMVLEREGYRQEILRTVYPRDEYQADVSR